MHQIKLLSVFVKICTPSAEEFYINLIRGEPTGYE